MKACSEVLRVADLSGGGRMLMAWCPGCEHQHCWFVVDDDGNTYGGPNHTWTWDGNIEQPTIGPSLHVHSHPRMGETGVPFDTPNCHSFVNAGVWDFLEDCTHHLKGQKVPMVALPDWLASDEYHID